MAGSTGSDPNRSVFSTHIVEKKDAVLKGFSSNKQTYLKDLAANPGSKKKQTDKYFEFITAPRQPRMKPSHPAGTSGSLKSLIQKFDDSSTGEDPAKGPLALSRFRLKSTALLKSQASVLGQACKKKQSQETRQLLADIAENHRPKDPGAAPVDLRFGTDKYLRHPLKDGLKLLLIGEELLSEGSSGAGHIRLFSEIEKTDLASDQVPLNFYIPKLSYSGTLASPRTGSAQRRRGHAGAHQEQEQQDPPDPQGRPREGRPPRRLPLTRSCLNFGRP